MFSATSVSHNSVELQSKEKPLAAEPDLVPRGLRVSFVARRWGRVDDLAAMAVNPIGHQARCMHDFAQAPGALGLRFYAQFRELTFPDDHRQGVVQRMGQQASFAGDRWIRKSRSVRHTATALST
jgi:hypothetical protein